MSNKYNEEILVIDELTGYGFACFRMEVRQPEPPPPSTGRSHFFNQSFCGDFDEAETYLPSERFYNMCDR